MMVNTLVDTLKNGSRQAHTEEGWIHALADVVEEIDWETAKWKLAPDVPSIWEILAHSVPYTEGLLNDLTGAAGHEEPDWPGISDQSETAWLMMRDRAIGASRRLQECVESLTAEELATPPPGKKTPRASRIMDIAIHDAYHAGQIVKLRQAFSAIGQAAVAHV